MILVDALETQSIFDIALQEYGTVEAVDRVIADNVYHRLNDLVPKGVPLFIDRNFVDDPIRREIFQKLRPISEENG